MLKFLNLMLKFLNLTLNFMAVSGYTSHKISYRLCVQSQILYTGGNTYSSMIKFGELIQKPINQLAIQHFYWLLEIWKQLIG